MQNIKQVLKKNVTLQPNSKADEMAEEVIINGKNYTPVLKQAVSAFWFTKERQLADSGDSSNRGAVVGGKQMDGFVELLRQVAVDSGVPAESVITDKNYLPGYFRSSKDWDMLVISPSGKLVAAVELKSQVGSYGNNFNNRTEEAIGSAVDLWTAFREGQFPEQQAPWVGWLMVVGRDKASEQPVRNYEPHFPVRPEFKEASYLDRYRILCQKLILERHYTSTALIWTSNGDSFGDVSSDISIARFLNSFSSYLKGISNEFK